MSIGDVSATEFTSLVRNAAARKAAVKSGQAPSTLTTGLANQTVAMMFSKRSTRTRVSTEAAVTLMGGNPMFLGKDDIQLGVCLIFEFTKAPINLSSRSMNRSTILQSSSHQ